MSSSALLRRPRSASAAAFLAALLAARTGNACAPVCAQDAAASAAPAKAGRATAELCALEKVVDGDTIHVLRGGKLEKLRLLCVDTEERVSGNPGFDPGKPQTVFGEECAQWAQRFFAELAAPGEKPRVGLLFPGGREELDAYGRLLCHVRLADGRDFNLLLVELGKSPYFNKYGNSEVCHEAFVRAQEQARARRIGIWDPRTNRPKTPGAPSAKRDYGELVPWWNARAEAVERFRARRREAPASVVASDDPEALERACAAGVEVEVFALIDRLFEEDDGSLTLLLRGGDKARSLRARIRKEARASFEPLEIARVNDDYRQNYLWLRGRVTRGERGFELACGERAQIRVAEPIYPPPKR